MNYIEEIAKSLTDNRESVLTEIVKQLVKTELNPKTALEITVVKDENNPLVEMYYYHFNKADQIFLAKIEMVFPQSTLPSIQVKTPADLSKFYI